MLLPDPGISPALCLYVVSLLETHTFVLHHIKHKYSFLTYMSGIEESLVPDICQINRSRRLILRSLSKHCLDCLLLLLYSLVLLV